MSWYPDIGVQPYFASDRVVIYCGDSLKLLPLFPHGWIRLVGPEKRETPCGRLPFQLIELGLLPPVLLTRPVPLQIGPHARRPPVTVQHLFHIHHADPDLFGRLPRLGRRIRAQNQRNRHSCNEHTDETAI